MQHVGAAEALREDAPVVHGGADGLNAPGGVNFPDFSISRLLHGVDLLPPQQLNQKIVQKVRSRADQDVLRIHPHSPEGRQMSGNGLPQLRDAPVGQGREKRFSKVQHDLPLQARPDGEGKLLRAVGGQVEKAGCVLLRAAHRGGGHRGAALHRLHEIAHLLL